MNSTESDIDLLRSFAAIADTGSFTAAGELVSRSQSAVSVQVMRLEQIVGRRIFERTSRSLALTAAGKTLLGYARRILALNDESMRRMVEPEITGAFRLGITEYFVPTELPAILARFAAAYPGVRLDVRMGLTRDLREELARKTLDAVIVRLSPREHKQATWSEPQVWVAPDAWKPMSGVPVPLVLLPEGCVLRQHALESMRRAKRAARIAFTGSSMVSVQAAVCAGIGLSIVPRSSLRPGMRVLAIGRDYPDPGTLDFGVLRAAGVDADIVKALERIIAESMDVLSARPMGARLRA